VRIRIPPALAIVCAVGALLRFSTLGVQSLWYDEAITAQLLRMDLGGLLRAIPDSESSPPLYYVLAWCWTHVFGTGEVGMRSLSALLGTATIAAVWALGRRLGGKRAALIAAALVAFNPLLVWFSQEARAYALLALLATVTALLWLRTLAQPKARYAAAWGLAAALTLATHYYAIFLVGPMALWLLVRLPGTRVRVAALAPVAVALLVLAPLALGQRANDNASFIGESSLLTRTVQVPKQLLVGYDAPGETVLAVLSGIALVIAIGGVIRILRSPAPSDSAPLAAVTAAALVLPLLAALAGEDHLITRNLLAAAPLGGALAGAGLAAAARAPTRPWLGWSAVTAGCVLGLVTVVGVNSDAASQRDDWRAAAAALGVGPPGRIVLAPGTGLIALGYYVDGLKPAPAGPRPVSEIDYLDLPERRPGALAAPHPAQAPPPIPGFAIAARTDGETFAVLRLVSPAAQSIDPATLTRGLDGGPAAVLITP